MEDNEKKTEEEEIDEEEFLDEAHEKEMAEKAAASEAGNEESIEEKKPEINLHKVLKEGSAELGPGPKATKDTVYEYGDESLKEIESLRASFNKDYKKRGHIRWIVSGSVLALIVLGYFIPQFVSPIKEQSWSIYITLGILIGAVAALGVYSVIARKKLNKAMQEYFVKYYEYLSKYLYGNRVEHIEGDVNSKVDPELIKEADLYENIYKIGSRNVLVGELGDKRIVFGDVAVQTSPDRKNVKTAFVGRMIKADNDYEGEATIIYFKGNSKGLPPTSVEHMNLIHDDEAKAIWSRGEASFQFNEKAQAIIDQIETNGFLIDLTISITSGKTMVFLGYDDAVMTIPMELPVEPSVYEVSKKSLDLAFDLIEAIR